MKTEKEVSAMTRMLSKFAMKEALEIEMEEHLGEKGMVAGIQEIPIMAYPYH